MPVRSRLRVQKPTLLNSRVGFCFQAPRGDTLHRQENRSNPQPLPRQAELRDRPPQCRACPSACIDRNDEPDPPQGTVRHQQTKQQQPAKFNKIELRLPNNTPVVIYRDKYSQQSALQSGVDNLRAHRHTPHPRFRRVLCSGVFTPLRHFIPRNPDPETICKNGYSICKSFNDCYSESSYLAS